jgi:hypothetical protein
MRLVVGDDEKTATCALRYFFTYYCFKKTLIVNAEGICIFIPGLNKECLAELTNELIS